MTEHLEDEVLNGGVVGTVSAIRFLQSLRDMLNGSSDKGGINLTTKWDGAPAIFAGKDPKNKKFFVATKGLFAQDSKINYTPQDIDKNHPGEGLNKKLKIALEYLPQIGIDGVIQGDIMFTSGDLSNQVIDGQSYVTFQPNTIVYAVPSNSTLAQQIKRAKIGIVWHTSYYGDNIASMKASFGVNIGKLRQTNDVWFRDAEFIDATGAASFTYAESQKLNEILSEMGSLFRKISAGTLNKIASMDTYKIQIKAWNNSKVIEGREITDVQAHTLGLINSIEKRLNQGIIDSKLAKTKARKTLEKKEIMSFYHSNFQQLQMIFRLQNLITKAKNMIVHKLQQVKDIGTFIKREDGFKVTSPEGFVAIRGDKAIKLIDRLQFSHDNFTVTKNWD